MKIRRKYSLLTLLLTLSGVLPGWCAGYSVRHYVMTMNVTSGTFNGQTYTGGFDVNVSGLIGTGTETLGPEAMSNFQLDIFGNHNGPLAQAASTVFSNGVLLNISTVLAFPSATEGNQNRSVGFNAGFSPGQVPANLVNGPWFGYLTPASFVDGFGYYDLTPPPVLRHFRFVVRLRDGTFGGQTYYGSFDVNGAALRGIGTEILPASAMSNFQLDIFGNHLGPLASPGSCEF